MTETLTLTAAISVIVAALVPFVAAIFTRPDMSATRKRVVAIAVAVVVAAVVAIATRSIEGVPESWSTTVASVVIAVGVIVSLAQGYYRAFKDAVKSLESATSSTPKRALDEWPTGDTL